MGGATHRSATRNRVRKERQYDCKSAKREASSLAFHTQKRNNQIRRGEVWQNSRHLHRVGFIRAFIDPALVWIVRSLKEGSHLVTPIFRADLKLRSRPLVHSHERQEHLKDCSTAADCSSRGILIGRTPHACSFVALL